MSHDFFNKKRLYKSLSLAFHLSVFSLSFIDGHFSALTAASSSAKENDKENDGAHSRIHRLSTRTSYAVGHTIIGFANTNDSEEVRILKQRGLLLKDDEFVDIPFYLEAMLTHTEGDLHSDLEEGLNGDPLGLLKQFKAEVNGIFDLMDRNDPAFTTELKKILYAAQLGGYGKPENALQLVGSLAYRINDDDTTTLIDKKAARLYVRGINKERSFLNNPYHLEILARLAKAGFIPAIALWHDHQEQRKKGLQHNPLLANILDPTTVAEILEDPDLSKETTKDGIPITPSMRINAIIETLPNVEYDNTLLFPALLDADDGIVESLAFDPIPLREKIDQILSHLPDQSAHAFIARTLIFPVPNNHASKRKEILLERLYERNMVPIEIKSIPSILHYLSDHLGEEHSHLYSIAMIDYASDSQNDYSTSHDEGFNFACRYVADLEKQSATEQENNQHPEAAISHQKANNAQAARNGIVKKLVQGIEGQSVSSALVAVADYFNCKGDNFGRNIASALQEMSMRAQDWHQFNELIEQSVIPSFGDTDGFHEKFQVVNKRLGIELALRGMDAQTTTRHLVGDSISLMAKTLSFFKRDDAEIRSFEGSSDFFFETLFTLINSHNLPSFSFDTYLEHVKEKHQESPHLSIISGFAENAGEELVPENALELMQTLLGDNASFFYKIIALMDETHETTHASSSESVSSHPLLKSILYQTLKAKSLGERQILVDDILNTWSMQLISLNTPEKAPPIDKDLALIQRLKIFNAINSHDLHDFEAHTWTSKRRYDILLNLCYPEIPSSDIENDAQTIMANALKGALMTYWTMPEDDSQRSMAHAVHFGTLTMKEAEVWNSLLGLANTNQRAQEAIVELLRLQSAKPQDQFDEYAKFLGYYYTLLNLN